MKDALSKRERAVLPLVAAGLRNREIAGRLGVQENWIKKLVSRLLQKLDCPNRAAIADRARERGWLDGNAAQPKPPVVDKLRPLILSSPILHDLLVAHVSPDDDGARLLLRAQKQLRASTNHLRSPAVR